MVTVWLLHEMSGGAKRFISEYSTLSPTASANPYASRVITDRFSNPSSPPCNVHDATFCGGSWASITSRLDYISQMGFTAIWISPINKNYDGPRTAYGDAYHGYWVSNIGELNPCFGSEDDLRRLIAEVHKRNMLIMVDIVVNHGQLGNMPHKR